MVYLDEEYKIGYTNEGDSCDGYVRVYNFDGDMVCIEDVADGDPSDTENVTFLILQEEVIPLLIEALNRYQQRKQERTNG